MRRYTSVYRHHPPRVTAAGSFLLHVHCRLYYLLTTVFQTIMVKKKKLYFLLLLFCRLLPKRLSGKMVRYLIQSTIFIAWKYVKTPAIALKKTVQLYLVFPLQFYLRNLTFLNILVKITLAFVCSYCLHLQQFKRR